MYRLSISKVSVSKYQKGILHGYVSFDEVSVLRSYGVLGPIFFKSLSIYLPSRYGINLTPFHCIKLINSL